MEAWKIYCLMKDYMYMVINQLISSSVLFLFFWLKY